MNGDSPHHAYQPSAAELRMLEVVVQQTIECATRHGRDVARFHGFRVEAERIERAHGRSHALVLTLGVVGTAGVLDRVLIEVAPHWDCGSACEQSHPRPCAIAVRGTESLVGCVSPCDARYASPESGQIS